MDGDDIVEVIKEGQIMRVTRMEAEEDDLFVLGKPAITDEVQEREASFGKMRLRESMGQMPPGIGGAAKVGKEKKVLRSLVDNFHWKIVRARRQKGLSRIQLADAIGENEETVKDLEYGEIPSDDFVLITKVEEQLEIELKKKGEDFNSVRGAIDRQVTLAELQDMRGREVSKAIEKAGKSKQGTLNLGRSDSGKGGFAKEDSRDLVGDDIEII